MLSAVILSMPLLFASATGVNTLSETKWQKVKALPAKEVSSTSYVQGNATIKEAIAFIQANGSTLTEITLTTVNNALVEACKTYCPSLSSFSIRGGLNRMDLGFTDEGLATIGSFPQLQSLVLDFWYAEKLTTAGMQKLLNLQNSLHKLYIAHPAFDDSCMSLITEFDPLQELTIYAIGVTDVGFTSLTQCQALQSSLQSLDLHIGSSFSSMNSIDDTLVSGLVPFKALTRLSLHGTWSATSANVVTLVNGLPELSDVSFNGFTMDSAVVSALATKPLQTLALSDCSQLAEADYTTLLTGLSTLTSLNLGSCTYLSNTNATEIAALSLTSLTLTGNGWMWNAGITAIGRSPTLQKSLVAFEFSGNNGIWSESFGHISSLPLQQLRIKDCLLFNDTTMAAIFKGPMAKSLQALELCNVSITDKVAANLGKFTSLNTLMVAQCGALTKRGITNMLKSSALTTQITKLYLDTVVLSKKMVPLLSAFSNIQVLVVGNPIELNFVKNARIFFKLPNLKKNHAQVEIYVGELTGWKDFVGA